jgi:CheY-like chemotaxis protein
MITQPNRILVADDNQTFLDTVAEVFERRHFSVEAVTNGRVAAELIATLEHLRLVITDHNMPGMSGVDVLRIARETRPMALRVLMSSEIGQDTDFDASLSKQCEPHELIKKPVLMSVLIGLIDRIMQHGR